jgi:hypothetical protein
MASEEEEEEEGMLAVSQGDLSNIYELKMRFHWIQRSLLKISTHYRTYGAIAA